MDVGFTWVDLVGHGGIRATNGSDKPRNALARKSTTETDRFSTKHVPCLCCRTKSHIAGEALTWASAWQGQLRGDETERVSE